MKSRFYAEIGSANREKGWQRGNLLQFIVAPTGNQMAKRVAVARLRHHHCELSQNKGGSNIQSAQPAPK